MIELVEQMKSCFAKLAETHVNQAGYERLRSEDTDLAPGFRAMCDYYQIKMEVWVRRGYRYFAGSSLTHDADVLLELTGTQMRPALVSLGLEAFADGVLIGYQNQMLVRMAYYYQTVSELFENTEFRELSDLSVTGFLADVNAMTWYREFLDQGLDTLAHITQWAHQEEVDPNRVWDLWLMMGRAGCGTSYLAGLSMGQEWQERDTLDGIEMVSEEVFHDADGEGD